MRTEILEALNEGEAVTIGHCLITQKIMEDLSDLQSEGYGMALYEKLHSATMFVAQKGDDAFLSLRMEYLRTLVELEDLLYHIVFAGKK